MHEKRNVRISGRRLITAMVAAGLGVATVAGTAAPASATSTGESVPGAYGQLKSVQRDSANRVNLHFWLRDTAADGDHAQARVQSLTRNDQIRTFGWHSAVGKGAVYEKNTHVSDSAGVSAVRIQVCRKGDDLPDICTYSNWLVDIPSDE